MKYLQDGAFSVGGASESYDKGYQKTFGKSGPDKSAKGKRFAIRNGELVEVGGDYVGQARGGGKRSEEEVFGKLQATDGTDISTRKRHRDYMKSKGLTLAGDFDGKGGYWERAKEKREARFSGNYHDPGIRESINKALYTLQNKKGKR